MGRPSLSLLLGLALRGKLGRVGAGPHPRLCCACALSLPRPPGWLSRGPGMSSRIFPSSMPHRQLWVLRHHPLWKGPEEYGRLPALGPLHGAPVPKPWAQVLRPRQASSFPSQGTRCPLRLPGVPTASGSPLGAPADGGPRRGGKSQPPPRARAPRLPSSSPSWKGRRRCRGGRQGVKLLFGGGKGPLHSASRGPGHVASGGDARPRPPQVTLPDPSAAAQRGARGRQGGRGASGPSGSGDHPQRRLHCKHAPA